MVDEFVRLLKSYPVGEQDREWFVRWIKRYQEFGRFGAGVRFEVDRAKTPAFCREILANGTPAWQRLQAVRCLIAYRALVLGVVCVTLGRFVRSAHRLGLQTGGAVSRQFTGTAG